MIRFIIAGIALWEGLAQIAELSERHQTFARAREYADGVGKPLLVVGAPKWKLNHPCGDITIDIDPEMASFCPTGQVADVRDIPYPDKYFGASYASHVIEHLPTVGDAVTALEELDRVSDRVFIVSPHRHSISAWLHPGHHLWVTEDEEGFIIEQRGNYEPARI